MGNSRLSWLREDGWVRIFNSQLWKLQVLVECIQEAVNGSKRPFKQKVKIFFFKVLFISHCFVCQKSYTTTVLLWFQWVFFGKRSRRHCCEHFHGLISASEIQRNVKPATEKCWVENYMQTNNAPRSYESLRRHYAVISRNMFFHGEEDDDDVILTYYSLPTSFVLWAYGHSSLLMAPVYRWWLIYSFEITWTAARWGNDSDFKVFLASHDHQNRQIDKSYAHILERLYCVPALSSTIASTRRLRFGSRSQFSPTGPLESWDGRDSAAAEEPTRKRVMSKLFQFSNILGSTS